MNHDVVIMFDENPILLKKRIIELEAERDKALENYQFMVNKACDEKLDGYRELGAKCASLAEERDVALAEVERLKAELREAVKRGDFIQGELTSAKGEVVSLKYGHTWQQERAAVVAWLNIEFAGRFVDVSLSYESKVIRNALVILAKSIERGEHWPEGGTP